MFQYDAAPPLRKQIGPGAGHHHPCGALRWRHPSQAARTVIVATLITLFSSFVPVGPAVAATTLVGSGASFPHQIYSLWFMLFAREHDGFTVDYTAKGSGGGVRDLQNHTVDFAASDAAMNSEEQAKIPEGVVLLPMTAGEVVLAYNLPGIETLKLPRTLYPEIFLGRISRWNDPAIVAANPGIELPELDITVVTRRDSSGTSFVFTRHLSAISAEFSERVGYGKKVVWPRELKMIQSSINAGISASISTTPGAIGYLDYSFAKVAGLRMAALENREGRFIAPGEGGGQAALASTPVPDDMLVWLPDPAGEASYPITTYTWLMFYGHYSDPEKGAALRNMVKFFLDSGQKIANTFGYIPLPEQVVAQVRVAAAQIE